MKKTLSDISKQIGLSTATISRVIHNEGNVTGHTRQVVLDALAENGYSYKARRRSVESQNADTVLIIAGQLTNPITVAYIAGIREVLIASGKRILISLSDYSETVETDSVGYAKSRGFAGIFMLNAMECDTLIAILKSIDIPVILVNRYLRSMDTDVVMVDNYRCGYLATQHLIERGHARIAHLAGPASSITCSNRALGYRDAMNIAGLTIPADGIFYADRTFDGGFAFGQKIAEMPAEERFTAVYCTAGLMADGMLAALQEHGIRVPHDVSVICSDVTHTAHPQQVKLTTVEQDPHTMGVAAAMLYLDRLKNPSLPIKHIVYPPVLIVKDSVKDLSQR
jgi:DNA-binding LacI/PurR family transcriptional regulator